MKLLLFLYVIILVIFLAWVVVISTRQEGFLFRRRYPPYFLPSPPTDDMFDSRINRSMKYGRGPSEYGRKTRKRAGF